MNGNERKNLTRSGIEVKPMRDYKFQNVSYDDIKVGDVLLAYVTAFGDNMLFLKIDNIETQMSLNDYGCAGNNNPKKSAISKIGRNILVRVTKKENDTLQVESKSIIDETVEYLIHKMNEVIDATVEIKAPLGLFVDLGNGVESLVYVNDIAKCRFEYISEGFEPGTRIKVKLLNYNFDSNFFTVSRKMAYEPIDIPIDEIITVKCGLFMDERKTAIFVEYDPGNSGLMNIPEELDPDYFHCGDIILVKVRSYNRIGFKCTFISKE